MWFGYKCQIIFDHFFHFVNLVIFRPQCITNERTKYFIENSGHIHDIELIITNII